MSVQAFCGFLPPPRVSLTQFSGRHDLSGPGGMAGEPGRRSAGLGTAYSLPGGGPEGILLLLRGRGGCGSREGLRASCRPAASACRLGCQPRAQAAARRAAREEPRSGPGHGFRTPRGWARVTGTPALEALAVGHGQGAQVGARPGWRGDLLALVGATGCSDGQSRTERNLGSHHRLLFTGSNYSESCGRAGASEPSQRPLSE